MKVRIHLRPREREPIAGLEADGLPLPWERHGAARNGRGGRTPGPRASGKRMIDDGVRVRKIVG